MKTQPPELPRSGQHSVPKDILTPFQADDSCTLVSTMAPVFVKSGERRAVFPVLVALSLLVHGLTGGVSARTQLIYEPYAAGAIASVKALKFLGSWAVTPGQQTLKVELIGCEAQADSYALGLDYIDSHPAAENGSWQAGSSTLAQTQTGGLGATESSTPFPPEIATQPVNKAAKPGATAKFSVSATGTAPLNYQWAKNGLNIAGATSASYITPPVTAGDNGSLFSVVVTNSVGSVTSDNAKLTVKKPPAITIQPSDETVTVGETAIFSVLATGTAPLSYQWLQDGVDIPGASSASYTIPATTTTDDSTYFAVTVSNSAGSVTSTEALLTVNPIEQEKVEQYGTTSTGVALRWTAFEPAGGGKNPAVIVLHVGGFKTGEAGPDSVSADLANAGFFALSTEYRLAPPHNPMNWPDHPVPSQDTVVPLDDGIYPEQTLDVQMAIRAARSDPRCDGRVYGVGGSAGASHVLYLAATGTRGDDQFDLEVCLSGIYKFDDTAWLTDTCTEDGGCPPQLIENYLGLPAGSALSHLPELAAASPITYLTRAIRPIFILASDHDGGGADTHQFPDLIAKLESIGFTESTSETPQRKHYKQLFVQVTSKKHGFAYWFEPISPGNPVLVRDQIVTFLTSDPPP